MAVRTARSRSKLDRDVVVDAALAVADADGLEAVTIRRLAHELAVTPMALYWHFEDKEALLAATADRLWDQTRAELDAGRDQGAGDDGWADLRRIVETLTTVLRRHPAVAALVPTRVVECPAGLSVTEEALGLLHGLGFGPERAALMARYVLCAAVMLVGNLPGAEIVEPAERAELIRHKRIALSSLPPERYPHTVAAADYLTDCESPDGYFAEGVDLVVAGVRGLAPVHGRTPAPRRRRS